MKRILFLFVMFLAIPIIINAQDDNKIEFIAIGGVNFYNLSFSSPESFPLPQHSARMAYNIGAGIEISLFDKFTFEIDTIYKNKKSELVEFSGIEWEDTFYGFQYLAFPVLAHYQIPVSQFKFFATFGIEADLHLKNKLEDSKHNITIEPIPDTKQGDLLVVAGFGIRHNKLSFEFRYGYGLDNLNEDIDSSLVIKNRGFEFLIGYRFYGFWKGK